MLQLGFLFLRYVAEPRTLWSWMEEFLQDREARGLQMDVAHDVGLTYSPCLRPGVCAQRG